MHFFVAFFVQNISSPVLYFIFFRGIQGSSPEVVHTPLGCGFGLWGHNPMLTILAILAILMDSNLCFQITLLFSPNVVFLSLPRNLTTTLPRSLPAGEVIARSYPIRTVIQFSICPSIGRQREGAKINPLCNIFCSAYNGKKSRYTAHQISGR